MRKGGTGLMLSRPAVPQGEHNTLAKLPGSAAHVSASLDPAGTWAEGRSGSGFIGSAIKHQARGGLVTSPAGCRLERVGEDGVGALGRELRFHPRGRSFAWEVGAGAELGRQLRQVLRDVQAQAERQAEAGVQVAISRRLRVDLLIAEPGTECFG